MSEAAASVTAGAEKAGAHGHDGDHHAGPHVVPLWMLAAVLGVLVLLTLATVEISIINIGKWDLSVAMLIATVKAMLVALIFMHLKWDRPFNGLVFLISILFMGFFLSFALMDSKQTEDAITRRVQDMEAAGIK